MLIIKALFCHSFVARMDIATVWLKGEQMGFSLVVLLFLPFPFLIQS